MEAATADPDTILEIKNLKTYFLLDKGTVKAVDGVNLKVDRKCTLGVVGESGCGKSVTFRSVMRIEKSPPGKIVDGEILLRRRTGQNGREKVIDLVKLDPKGRTIREIRGGEISMIFQEPMTSLNPLYTVGDQIAEAVELHQRVRKKAALERALEMLYKVHISDPKQRIKQYPHQLSGGMRQRVMIALALSCNPDILIADEPTTALDVTVQAQILDLMRELQQDFDSAIILITHNLGVVSQMADHVAVMYFGKVVEHAPVREIYHNPHHPYTIGLLNSVPVLGKKKKELLVPIEGMVPNATDDIKGCAFAPRCPHAMEICEEQPLFREIKPDHQVACWLHQ
jgi:peptide/nickel transport system ATP-binding protein/oligopeptide transport system ATP-binding protein